MSTKQRFKTNPYRSVDVLGDAEESGKISKREKAVWEERRGTYNPDAFLKQFQASPWSSA